MIEVAYGSVTEVLFIKAYIESLRSLEVHEIFSTVRSVVPLDIYLHSGSLSPGLFFEALDYAKCHIQTHYAADFVFLPLSRWFVDCAPNTRKGGFFDPGSAGYLDHYAIGISAQPNILHYKIADLSTLEILRCYIHDSLHAFSYRSYRMSRHSEAIRPKQYLPHVNRYQYGINFRDSEGISFSIAQHHANPPQTINLNLLMDGTAVILQSQCLKNFLKVVSYDLPESSGIIREVLGNPVVGDRGFRFSTEIVRPAYRFLKHWSLLENLKIIGSAIQTGDVRKLEEWIASRDFIHNRTWNELFRRPEFHFEDRADDVRIGIASFY